MIGIAETINIIQPRWGWLLLIGWMFWQAISSKYINGYEPTLHPLFELSNNLERLQQVEEKQDSIFDELREVRDLQEKHVQVSRAHSRALDEKKDVSVTSDEVDQYLLKNGVAIETFLDSSNEDEAEE